MNIIHKQHLTLPPFHRHQHLCPQLLQRNRRSKQKAQRQSRHHLLRNPFHLAELLQRGTIQAHAVRRNITQLGEHPLHQLLVAHLHGNKQGRQPRPGTRQSHVQPHGRFTIPRPGRQKHQLARTHPSHQLVQALHPRGATRGQFARRLQLLEIIQHFAARHLHRHPHIAIHTLQAQGHQLPLQLLHQSIRIPIHQIRLHRQRLPQSLQAPQPVKTHHLRGIHHHVAHLPHHAQPLLQSGNPLEASRMHLIQAIHLRIHRLQIHQHPPGIHLFDGPEDQCQVRVQKHIGSQHPAHLVHHIRTQQHRRHYKQLVPLRRTHIVVRRHRHHPQLPLPLTHRPVSFPHDHNSAPPVCPTPPPAHRHPKPASSTGAASPAAAHHTPPR